MFSRPPGKWIIVVFSVTVNNSEMENESPDPAGYGFLILSPASLTHVGFKIDIMSSVLQSNPMQGLVYAFVPHCIIVSSDISFPNFLSLRGISIPSVSDPLY